MIQPDSSPSFEAARPPRTTLKDIALKANLSVASVSMALRNHSNVSEKTIARVKAIARSLGYSPDPALSALAAYRRGLRGAPIATNIAVVSNWATTEGWQRFPNARLFLAGATTRASELGYSLQNLWARAGEVSPRRLADILKARGIRGMILAPFEASIEPLAIDWEQYCVAALGRPVDSGPFDFVEPDHFRSLALAWDKLLDRGYRRPGLVVDEGFAVKWEHRTEAAYLQLQRLHAGRIQGLQALTVGGAQPVEQIRAWLRKHQPDVVLAHSARIGDAMAAENLVIPRDLGYIGLDLDDDRPHAAGIAQRFDTLGVAAMDILHKRLIGNLRGPCEEPLGIQVCGRWREGLTLATR